jgi:hypothetical protein
MAALYTRTLPDELNLQTAAREQHDSRYDDDDYCYYYDND